MKITIDNPNDHDIIQTYARMIPFPSYWQQNWNSFEECLRDALSVRNELLVVHLFSESSLKLNSPYMDIIHRASADFPAFSYIFAP